MSKQINWIDLLLNALQIGRTSQFIGYLGVTIRLSSIDGSDETVHREPFQLKRDHLILMERSDESTWIYVMKRITSPSLDRDPTLRMHSPALNLNRYNPSSKTRALDGDLMDHESTRSTRTNRWALDPMLLHRPRHLHFKTPCGTYSHTGKIKGESLVYKMRRIQRVSEFQIRNAYMYYNPKYNDIYMYTCHIAPRRHSRWSTWLCHVALHATSHPRGSRAKINSLFALFKLFLILKNRK